MPLEGDKKCFVDVLHGTLIIVPVLHKLPLLSSLLPQMSFNVSVVFAHLIRENILTVQLGILII